MATKSATTAKAAKPKAPAASKKPVAKKASPPKVPTKRGPAPKPAKSAQAKPSASKAAKPGVASDKPREQKPARVAPGGDYSGNEKAVVVTGIAGRLGRLLAQHLHKTEKLIGIDARPFPGKPKDVEHYEYDLRQNRVEAIFRKGDVRALVHIGVMHNPTVKTREHHHYNILGTTRVLDYARRYGLERAVVLSSANIYGARPENDTFLTEEAPLLGGETYSEMTDIVEVDMLAQSYFWKAPDLKLAILRPTHVVGEDVGSPANRYLALKRAPTILGFDPMVQVLHARDLVEAFARALSSDANGVFNIAYPDAAPLSTLLDYLGRSHYPVPYPFLKRALESAWRSNLTHFPPAELQYIHFPLIVDGARARAQMGFTPRYDLKHVLDAIR
jgi:UDP-glucose 4-epimerase